MKNYKIVFVDLDNALIETRTDDIFPKGVWDMQIRFDVFNALKKLKPVIIVIITNQGEIHRGKIDVLSFIAKLNYIKRCLVDYIGCQVFGEFCSYDEDDNKYKMPNIGMLLPYEKIIKQHGFFKEDCVLIGNSTENKLTAENFGIDFVNISDFIK